MSNLVTVDASDLVRLQNTFKKYAEYNQRDLNELVAKKGNDIRIKFYQEYRKLKGTGGKGGKVFWNELKKRAKANKGTLVRFKTGFANSFADKVPSVDKRGRKLSFWQQMVAQEVLRRSSGIGVLGATYLAKRWRENSTGRRLVTNKSKTIGVMSTIEQRDITDGSEFILTVFTAGSAKVASKYGILSKVINASVADMETYIKRKTGESITKALK